VKGAREAILDEGFFEYRKNVLAGFVTLLGKKSEPQSQLGDVKPGSV